MRPASDATGKWATHDYAIDRVVIALRGALGRGIVGAYRHGWPWLHRIRTMGRPAENAPTPRPIDAAIGQDDRKLPSEAAVEG